MFDSVKRLFCKSKPIPVTVYSIADDFGITPQKAFCLLRFAEERGLAERVTVDCGVIRPMASVHWVIYPENEAAALRFIGERSKQFTRATSRIDVANHYTYI